MTTQHPVGRHTTVALSNAQLVMVLFFILTLTGFLTAGAYVAGRNQPPAEPVRNHEAAPLVIDPPEKKVGNAPVETAPAGALVSVQPPPATSAAWPPAPTAPPAAVLAKPKPLQQADAPSAQPLYFQVGALEKGMAEACKEYLTSLNFKVLVVPSKLDEFYRVLVGPMTNPEEISQTREALTAKGFRPYLRK